MPRRILSAAIVGMSSLAVLSFDTADVPRIALTVAIFVICLAIHEVAHGWVALKCGDTTARDLGRLTLNPIPHIDPIMTIALPAIMLATVGFAFGGAKPVPVSFHRLRNPWRDMSLVAIAGPASNFLLAIVCLAAWHLFVTKGWYNGAAQDVGDRPDDLLPAVLFGAARFNALLAVFNLVPIPPLDGSRVMAYLLPDPLRDSYVRLERFGLFIVMGLLVLSPAFNSWISRSVASVLIMIHSLVTMGGRW